jgi:hypothetical protein
LLEALLRFKSEQSTTYTNIRDFNQSLIHLDPDMLPEEVRIFIRDWETVTRERNVTEPSYWDGLIKAHQRARQAITNQIAQWRQEIIRELSDIEISLRERLLTAGVPTEQIDTEVASFVADMQIQRNRLEQSDLGYSEALRIRGTISGIRINLPTKVREVTIRYQPKKKTSETQELRLRWQDIMGSLRISTLDDVESAITTFRQRVSEELGQEKTLLIE